jgi:serine/threonine protein kinase
MLIEFAFILVSAIIRQVTQGLLYLHSHRILHRDLTLANLLLSNDSSVVSPRNHIY